MPPASPRTPTARSPALMVRKVRGMGRGVFAGRSFRTGEIIEVCPILHLDGVVNETQLCGGLNRYVFKWGRDESELVLALGYGSLYNHSATPNATFAYRLSRGEIVFRAIRPIPAGEQIQIDYGWDEADYADFTRRA